MLFLASALALLIGMTLGLLGAGGGILTVPLLHYVLGLEARQATSASLVIVGATAALAAAVYLKHKLVDLRAALTFALPSSAGMILSRTVLLPALPPRALLPGGVEASRDALMMVPFAVVMFFAAWRMLRKTGGRGSGPQAAGSDSLQPPVDSEGRGGSGTLARKHSPLRTFLSGAFVGVLSGFVGAGGGFLIVPALHLGLGVAMTTAIGTSLVIIALNSGVGVVSDLTTGHFADIGIVGLMTTMSLLGMLAGLRLASRLSGAQLRPFFGGFMIVMSVVIFVREIWP